MGYPGDPISSPYGWLGFLINTIPFSKEGGRSRGEERAMASITTATLTSPLPVDGKPTSRQHAAAAASCSLSYPALPPAPVVGSPRRGPWKSATSCRRNAQSIVVRSTGEAPVEASTELPEVVKVIQETWDKLDDKYAVTSLGVAAFVALWGSTGMISAIDRLPLIPGVLELVGIGYTGWFTYRNLVFKPDREALLSKIQNTYSEIIGSS